MSTQFTDQYYKHKSATFHIVLQPIVIDTRIVNF